MAIVDLWAAACPSVVGTATVAAADAQDSGGQAPGSELEMGRTSEETWVEYRKRMLAETERFIEWGLRHPELVTWIPAKRVATGGFPRKVADWFYLTVFWPRGNSRARFWRRRLRLGARLFGRQPPAVAPHSAGVTFG